MRAGTVAWCAPALLILVGCGTQSKIVGKGRGSLTATAPPASDNETAADKSAQALALALAKQLTLETEYRPDGTCSLAFGAEKKNGTWTMNGNQLVHVFEGHPGVPVIVTWDGPDKFTMSGEDAPIMIYVRDK